MGAEAPVVKRSSLHRDAERVREWLDKHRSPLSLGERVQLERRQELSRRRAPLARRPRKRRAAIPKAMRARIYARSQGRCVVCRTRRATTLHHVFPVQRWPELELEEANLIGLCWECHDAHERALPRVPHAQLPRQAVELAKRVGPDAEAYIERTYPV